VGAVSLSFWEYNTPKPPVTQAGKKEKSVQVTDKNTLSETETETGVSMIFAMACRKKP
jgi:hypothetical protein